MLTLALALLGACGSSDGPTAAPAASAAPTTQTITDMTGRTMTLPAKITRVATDYPALNATMLVLDNLDTVVASMKSAPRPLFETVYPRLKNIPTPFSSTLTTVNIEGLLATRPQVVFAATSAKALVPQLEKAGIPVVLFASFLTPADLKAGGDLIAKIMGGEAPARAKAYDAYYDGIVAKVTARTKDLPAAQRPKGYYTADSPTSTEGKDSIITTWMTQGGGTNTAADHGITKSGFSTVSAEDVVGWNPDYIICRDAPTVKQIMSSPAYSSVTAVKDKHVLGAPQGVFTWAARSAESALQPLWAGKTFHPELFTDVNLENETRTFYEKFYSYKLTDAQIHDILVRG